MEEMFYNNENPNEVKNPTEKLAAADSSEGKTTSDKKNEKTFGKKIGTSIACGLTLGVVAGAAFFGVNYGINKLVDNKTVTSYEANGDTEEDGNNSPATSDMIGMQTLSDTSTSNTFVYDVSAIAENVEPSIVSITTVVTTTYQYWFQDYTEKSEGAGSGIIIGRDDNYLYVATNYHVVEGAEEINVGFVDTEVVQARVKGTDKERDLAVVAVALSDMNESTAKKIKVARIGNSDRLKVGEPAIAIGNALGYGQSVTVGYISALDRTIQGNEGTYIQTDAAINPGNSGGALINSSGEVIGINSVKYVDSRVEGMGFSIPINDAISICNDIISGVNEKVCIGIAGANVSREYSQIYGFPQGIYITEFTENSPAEKAGLHVGDIIVEFDGQSVYTIEELKELISKKNEGDIVKVVFYRQDAMGNYQRNEIEVELGLGDIG